MSRHNTGNPIGSDSPLDLQDNAKNFDIYSNSEQASFPNRFGVQQPTIAENNRRANLQIQAAIEAKILAEQARDDAVNAAASTGVTDYADSHAAMVAAGFPDGSVVMVFADETRSGATTIYRIESGTPAFKANTDRLRLDLALPNGSGIIGFKDSNIYAAISATTRASDQENTALGINAAIGAAMSGDKVLNVDIENTSPSADLRKDTTELSFVGEGGVKNAYRKFVVPARRQEYIPKNTITPSQHLPNLSATNTPIVVIMGDSIATDGPDSDVYANSMWGILKEKLQRDNPKKTFSFYNRAVGGQTWLTANTKPTAFPFWYTDQNKDWLSYAEELQPDVLFLAFGMNDSNGFNTGGMIAVVNKIKAWAKVPDLVFVTNPVPSRATTYPDGQGTGFAQPVYQEGRDLVAGFERTYALKYGHAIVDINRAMVAARDSYDVFAGPMYVAETIPGNSGAEFRAAQPAIDFSVSGEIDGSGFLAGNVLSVSCGQHSLDFLYVFAVNGKYIFSGYVNAVGTYAEINTGVSASGGSSGLEISVIGGIARLILTNTDATSRSVIAEFPVIRHGGTFAPVVKWQGAAGSPFQNIVYASSYSESYKQTVTDTDVWGAPSVSAAIVPVTGGNGINHYSADGLQLVVRPVVEALDFACGESLNGTTNGWRWFKRADGSSECHRRVGFSRAVATAAGSIFVDAQIVELSDFPQIFAPTGVLPGELNFETSVSVQAASANFVFPVSSGSSLSNNAVRFRLASPTAIETLDAVLFVKLSGFWK